MKILITGANGFIGRNLKEFLEKKYDIYAPNRRELNLLEGSLVKKYLYENSFDVIIHSAVTLYSIKENLDMYFNLESNSSKFGKLICIGSGAEFDKRNYIPKMQESYFGKFIPEKSDIYGFSKYTIAKDIIEKNKNIYNLRVFGIFGKFEDYRRRLISNNICRVLCGLDVSINKNMYFDYIYVGDFCKILEKFIKKNAKEKTYNVCTGQPVDLLSIVKIIRELDHNKKNIYVQNAGMNMEYSGSNEKFISEFGHFSFTEIKESIKELYNWYKNDSGLVFNDKIFDKWIKN